MRIYKDIFTDDELCADTYPMKVDNGVILEFTGKYVVRKEGEIVLAGSNASAEGEDADDAADDSGNVERGIDIILNHRLVDMTSVYGDAKQFKDFIKTYMGKLAKKLKEDGKSDDELKEWQKNMQAWVVGLIKKERFKDLMFYSGPAEDAIEGQLAIMEYRDMADGEKPIVMFIKDGLVDEKV